MNTSQTTSAGLLNLLSACLLLLLVAMPQVAAQSGVDAEKDGPDCSINWIEKSFIEAKFPNDKIKEIQTKLFSVGYHPGRIDGLLGDDTYEALGQFCRSLRVDESLKAQNAETPEGVKALAELTIELLERTAGTLNKPEKILLSGDGCGCSRNFKEHSLVYGFYPHWLADGNEHVVDFSLFDRVGFYALELNQQGYVKHNLQWPSEAGVQPNVADFISQAHKHQVDVDVTFYASSWQNWEYEQIDRATDIMVDTVTREFKSSDSPRWRKYMPLVDDYPTESADGINLFFDDYTDSEQRESWKELLAIVNELAEKRDYVNESTEKPEYLRKLVEIVNEQAVKSEGERDFSAIESASGGGSGSRKELLAIVNSLTAKPESERKLLEIANGSLVSVNGSLLVGIVKKLSSKLKQVEPDAKLNIMLGLNLAYVDKINLKVDSTKPEPADFINLYRTRENELRKLEGQFKALEKILDADHKIVDNVFVFLTQDTSKSKKNLRQVIENAFEGAARQTVLRKIVPIVVAQGLAKQKVTKVTKEKYKRVYGDGITQFKDDLIYMQDNFAGIGLWHLPLTQEKEAPKDEIAKKEVAEKEAPEIAAVTKEAAAAANEAVAAANEAAAAANEAAAAANEAADRATAATKAAENASGDDAASMNQAAEKAQTEQEAAEKVAAAKEAEKKAAEEKAAEEKAAEEKKTAQQADVNTLREALEAIYWINDEFAFLGETIKPYANRLCEYACPNRWGFRIAFSILLALAVIYALLALRNCRLREFYQRRFIYFASYGYVTAMIFMVTLVCDPFFRQKAAYMLIGILLLIIVGFRLRQLRRNLQPPLP